MVSSSAVILSVKALLISAGVLCIATGMKVSVPLITDYAIYKIPLFWSTLLSWLKPPYLYVVINGIIITIVASSRFYQKHDHEVHSYDSAPLKAPPADLPSDLAPVSTQLEYAVADSPAVDFASEPAQLEYDVVVSTAVDFSPEPAEREYGAVDPPVLYDSEVSEVQFMDVKPVVVNGSVVAGDEDEDELEISQSTCPAPQTINPPAASYLYLATGKPPVSSRFSNRKPVKGSFEGGSEKALRRVAKERRHETLENTWKMITDGRHVPLTRHLRKSDTFETHGSNEVDSSPPDQSHQGMDKSETFKDRTNYSRAAASSSAGIGRLRKEPSPSQEELNRRVEAFIKKFNEDMRLERLESLNRYQEMINRGAH